MKSTRNKNKMLGKSLPVWLLGAGMIMATAGAATGVILAGNVTGVITATVSQALVLRDNFGTSISNADRSLVTVSDDGTRFTASAEINTGDEFLVNLSLANLSNAELTGDLTLLAPEGITLSVDSAGDMTQDAVRTGPFEWKFRMPVSDNATTDLVIHVALADDMPPGFYAIDGSLKQVAQ